MRSRLLAFVLVFALGVAAGALAPRLWDRLAPPALRGEPTVGTVESKRWEQERLLLTLITDSGAVLATFRERVSEIDLLVDPGDSVALALRGYRPFVEDPVIQRVVKAEKEAAAAPSSATTSAPSSAPSSVTVPPASSVPAGEVATPPVEIAEPAGEPAAEPPPPTGEIDGAPESELDDG